MLNRNMLRGKIVENGYTQATVAKELSISRTTFYRKILDGSFTIEQAEKICDLLHIDNPADRCEIFLPSASHKWDGD